LIANLAPGILREFSCLVLRCRSIKISPGKAFAMRPLVRRSLAVLIAALLAAVFAVAGTSAPASAAPVKGYLRIVSITDNAEPLTGVEDRPFDIVKDRPFSVVVEVRDAPQDPATPGIEGQLTTVTRATDVVLEEVSGPGSLTGTTKATIPRDGSTATIPPEDAATGVEYSEYANGVKLRVVAGSGVDLEPSQPFTVNVALTAVSENIESDEVGQPLDLKDSNCGAPTSDEPTCGRLLLPAAAAGHVVMSVGSCDGLGCDSVGPKALVVTAIFNGNYSAVSPATVILACDKVVCGQSGSGAGLPLTVIYTFVNDAGLGQTAPACPAKGVLGPQAICVDYVQSSRHQGDLYTHVLLGHDVRLSHP
jgi:hypothetical protein